MLLAEVILLRTQFPAYLLFLLVGAGFLGGIVLRILKIYPGEDEPLLLDIVSFLLASLFSLLLTLTSPTHSSYLIYKYAFPPVLILPHLIYILTTPTIQ